MKNKRKAIFVISVLFFLLWGIGAGILFFNAPKKCVDYFEIDEIKLKQICNVTKQELLDKLRVDPDFCPDKTQAYVLRGGCSPEYRLAALGLILPTVIWFGLLGVILLFIGLHKKK